MEEIETLFREECFHDEQAFKIPLQGIDVNAFFNACTCPENRLILDKIGDIKGKKILDLGCGWAEAAVYFAKRGAIVTALDISSGMLESAKKLARRENVSLSDRKASACRTGFDNETFDIVYAANLLHHVNLEDTITEAFRVLKKGGIFVSWDPLAHNFIINIYRKIAKEVRSEDEHPLRIEDLKIFKRYFYKVEFETTWFFTLWVFVKFYLFDRIDPNKVKYWKRIIAEHKKLEKIYLPLQALDKIFLRFFPFLKRYCWNIVIFSYK